MKIFTSQLPIGPRRTTASRGDWKNSYDKFHKLRRQSNEKIPSCSGAHALGPKVNQKIKRKIYRTKRGAELIRRSVKWETIKSQQGKEREMKKKKIGRMKDGTDEADDLLPPDPQPMGAEIGAGGL